MRLDGRNEKRVTMALPVCLVTADKLVFTDQAVTVNVSSNGARVMTRHRWEPEARPVLASSSGEIWTQAKVVYCELLANGYHCIGLEFSSPIKDWKTTGDFRRAVPAPELRYYGRGLAPPMFAGIAALLAR